MSLWRIHHWFYHNYQVITIKLMSLIELTKILSCQNFYTILQHECLLQKAPFLFLVKEAFLKKRYYSHIDTSFRKSRNISHKKNKFWRFQCIINWYLFLIRKLKHGITHAYWLSEWFHQYAHVSYMYYW